MMKVDVEIPDKTVLTTQDMLTGDIAEVTDSRMYSGAIMLRTYDGFVNLRNPKQVLNQGCSLGVRILPKGTKITLEVTD